jgi:hypothetical protein
MAAIKMAALRLSIAHPSSYLFTRSLQVTQSFQVTRSF